MIRFRCPDCDGLIMTSTQAAGLPITCEHCRGRVEVPPPGAATFPEPTQPPVREEWGPPLIDQIGKWLGAHASAEPPAGLNVRKRIVYTFLGLFLTLLFGGMALYGASSFVECVNSSNWPTVEGKVESADVAETVKITTKWGRKRKRSEYSASVVYRYKVGDKEYTSARIGFGPSETYSFLAAEQAQQYRHGQAVKVTYEPGNPQNAVLKRVVMFSGYLYTLVGLFVGFIGVRLLLTALTPTMRSSNSRWLPWSHRFTWVDLPLMALGLIGVVLWLPMLFGL